MKPAAFAYERPATLAAALAALGAGDADTRVLAGGQSLGPMMNLRLARPRRLVDVSRLAELRGLASPPPATVLGAALTHAEIEDAPARPEAPELGILAGVAAGVAYRAVRNRGTVGGSLAHADPAADWPAALIALGARAELARAGARRTIPLPELIRGAYATGLADGELIVGVAVPRLSGEARWGYHKICRKVGDFPLAIGAVLVDPPRRVCRVVAGALGGAPIALPGTAAELARTAAAPGLERVKAELRAAAGGAGETKLHLVAVSVHRAATAVCRA